ncbi:MAG: hypothetical protein KME45_07615 [Stenomitos rutilans HA7619-LM2]|jgi:hypothetical protein|nr:hypothetical protein [Stenomitos rutilans HA7619-LM2]
MSIPSLSVLLTDYRMLFFIRDRTINSVKAARADKQLFEEMSKYIRHIAVYKALRESEVFDKDSIAFGKPFPKHFFSRLAAEKEKLQQEFDRLLDLERKA